MNYKIGIIGGGIAGSTAAIKLSQLGIKTFLFQASSSLVNGPPMCHLHAGGALYRQISTEQCVKLLKQSIDTLKLYKFSANFRPTLLTVPKRDQGQPSEIIQRMKILTQQYQKLINQQKSNSVLGNPQDYFKIFSKQQVYRLRELEIPKNPKTVEDWLIPPAKYLDLQQFKFPFIMVQQPGLSSLKVAAHANVALQKSQNCKVYKNTTVTKINKIEYQRESKWLISFKQKQSNSQKVQQVDFILNACGYRSGQIDDMAGFKKKRLLQFKAAYVSKWSDCKGKWPEVIIHGKRKTPQGMAQLTPYPNNYFQIHGMTQEITLFKNGLVQSNDVSSQPKFGRQINKILKEGWNQNLVLQRTRKAIQYVSNFIPQFWSAEQTKKPLYGAQQIPGSDPNLRASEIQYEGQNYARAEIVKASTAVEVAQKLILKLKEMNKISIPSQSQQNYNQITCEEVAQRAKRIAVQRNYPQELAEFYY